jgi:hypothetical protein
MEELEKKINIITNKLSKIMSKLDIKDEEHKQKQDIDLINLYGLKPTSYYENIKKDQQ